jgi:hypothetical protein
MVKGETQVAHATWLPPLPKDLRALHLAKRNTKNNNNKNTFFFLNQNTRDRLKG